MGIIKYLMVMTLCISLFTGCKEDTEEKKDTIYYDIAKDILTSMNIKIDEGELLFDRDNRNFNGYLGGVNNPDFSILKEREFQSIIYCPRAKRFSRAIQLGGEIWIFIDTKTKKVIYVHRGK